jgi:hypothetical protein
VDRIRKSANFYLGIVIAAVLVIALIVALASNNSTKTLNAGSPERIVQEFLQSLNDGRNDVAVKLLASDSSCSIQDIDRAYHSPSTEISLLESQITGNTAVVRVSVQRDPAAMMDTSSDEELTYRLVKNVNQWRISGIPWPLYDCGGVKK